MKFIKRLTAFMLTLVLVFTSTSVSEGITALAAVADEYTSKLNEVADKYAEFSNNKDDLYINQTTTVFVTTIALVDTTNYKGNGVQAYNDVVYPTIDDMSCKLWNTAFTYVDTTKVYTASQVTDSSQPTTYNFLLDTIQAEHINTSYCNNIYGVKLYSPMVNFRENTEKKEAEWVNALMNSSKVSGGSSLVLEPEEGLNLDAPVYEVKCLNTLASKTTEDFIANSKYRLPVIAWDDNGNIKVDKELKVTSASFDTTDGTAVISANGEEYVAGYDWSDPSIYKIVTMYQPIVVPVLYSGRQVVSTKVGYVMDLSGEAHNGDYYLCSNSSYLWRFLLSETGRSNGGVSGNDVYDPSFSARAKFSKRLYINQTSVYRNDSATNAPGSARQYFLRDYLTVNGVPAGDLPYSVGSKIDTAVINALDLDVSQVYTLLHSINTLIGKTTNVEDLMLSNANNQAKATLEEMGLPVYINYIQNLVVGSDNWVMRDILDLTMPRASNISSANKDLPLSVYLCLLCHRNSMGYYMATGQYRNTDLETVSYNAFNSTKMLQHYRDYGTWDSKRGDITLSVYKVPGYEATGEVENDGSIRSRVTVMYRWQYRIWYMMANATDFHRLQMYVGTLRSGINSDVLAGRSYNLSNKSGLPSSETTAGGSTDMLRNTAITYSDLSNIWAGTKYPYVVTLNGTPKVKLMNMPATIDNTVELSWMYGNINILKDVAGKSGSDKSAEASLLSLYRGQMSTATVGISDTIFCNMYLDEDAIMEVTTTGNFIGGYKVYGLSTGADYSVILGDEGVTLSDGMKAEKSDGSTAGPKFNVEGLGELDSVELFKVVPDCVHSMWRSGTWHSKLTIDESLLNEQMMFVIVPLYVYPEAGGTVVNLQDITGENRKVEVSNRLYPSGFEENREYLDRIIGVPTNVRYGLGVVKSSTDLKLGIGCDTGLTDEEGVAIRSVTDYTTLNDTIEFDKYAVAYDDCVSGLCKASNGAAFYCQFAIKESIEVVRDGSIYTEETPVDNMVLDNNSSYHLMAETEAYLYPQLPEDFVLPFYNNGNISKVTVTVNNKSLAADKINVELDTSSSKWNLSSSFDMLNSQASKAITIGGSYNRDSINEKLKNVGVWIDGFGLNDSADLEGGTLDGKGITWTLKFEYIAGTGYNETYETEVTITPVLHKWDATAEGTYISNPEPMCDGSDVELTFNNKVGLPTVGEGVVLNGYANMEVQHKLSPEEGYAELSAPKNSTASVFESKSGVVLTAKDNGAVGEKKGISSYVTAGTDVIWRGNIASGEEEGSWVAKDTITVKTLSVRTGNSGGSLSLEALVTVEWSSAAPLPAHFTKGSADYGESVGLYVHPVKLADVGISGSISASDVAVKISEGKKEFSVKEGTLKVTCSGGTANITFDVVANSTENKSITLELKDVTITIKGSKFSPVICDEPSGAFSKVEVPKPWACPVTLTTVLVNRTLNAAKGGTINIPYILQISASEDYKDWSERVKASNSLGKSCEITLLTVFMPNKSTVTKVDFIETKPSKGTITVTTKDNQMNFVWKGTNEDLMAVVGSSSLFQLADIDVQLPTYTAADVVVQSTGGTFVFTHSGGSTTFQLGNNGSAGPDEIVPTPLCITWDEETRVKDAFAVLTATNPDPTLWRWDALSGIPASEKLSLTVGADLYKVAMAGRTHVIGAPCVDESVKEANNEGEAGVSLSNAAVKRTLTFKVNFTDVWGTSMCSPCQLSCSGHSICSGGTSNSGSCKATVTATTSNGTTVTKTANGNVPAWTCPKCGWQYAGHTCTQTASATGKDAVPAKGSPGDDDYKPAKPAQSASKTSSCSHSWSHDCTWSYEWNCSSNSGRFSSKGSNSKASAAPESSENSHGQRWNLDNVTVTNGNETVTGNNRSETLLDRGYTTGYGCSCSNRLNMAHPTTRQHTFTIVESVDAVVWNTIDNFCISVLSNAEITDAQSMFQNAEGRKVLTSGISFSLWRGDDGSLTTTCNEQGNNAQSLLGTGRMYFTDFPSENAEGATVTAGNTYKPNVTIEFTTVANRNTYQQYVDSNPDGIKDKISEYVFAYIDKNNYNGYDVLDGVTSSVGTHYNDASSNVTNRQFESSRYPGDYMTTAESTYIAALIVNNWMVYNQQDDYRPNFIGDAATVRYNGMVQNVRGWAWSTDNYDVNLFNTTFNNSRTRIYRNHICGFETLEQLISQAHEEGVLTNALNTKLFVGFTGNYSPSGGMYGQESMSSDYDLVEELQMGEVPFDYMNGTNFMRNSTVDTSKYDSVDGEVFLSGQGTVSTTTEYYGPVVDSVSSDVTQTFVTDGSVLNDSTTVGEALLDFEGAGARIEDATRLTFLGIGMNEETGNGLIQNPMTVYCNYKCLYSIITDNSNEADMIEDMAEDSSLRCKPADGFSGTINPIVVTNPVSTQVWIVGNEQGNTSIYKVDESKEDMRTDSTTERSNSYVVIGNTFHLWVTDVGVEGDSTSFNNNNSAISWSGGTAGNKTTGEVFEGTYGYGEFINTEKWIDKRYVVFSFPVSYINRHSGNLVHVSANQQIDLDEVMTYDYNGSDEVHRECADENFATQFNHYGIGYEFTCELSAAESNSASATVYAERLDPANSQPIAERNNYAERGAVQAANIVSDTVTFDIVGRIGDLVLTDTQDYRYSNLFWETTDEWLIQDVVKTPTLESRLNIRTKYNIMMNTLTPAYGSILTGQGAYTGIVSNRELFPLQGDQNNIDAFKGTNLGLGYAAYFGITTVGNYDGYNLPGTTYPHSYEEAVELNGIDGRTNYMDIQPIYVLYDKDTGEFYDVDLYAGSGTNYTLFYNYENVPANVANALYTEVNDETEQGRYAISDFAKYYNLAFNDLDKSIFTERVFVGTSKQLRLDYNSNMVIGTRYADSAPQSFNTDTDKYYFTDYTANGATVASSSKQTDADYALNARRWFFNLGMPTSTIAVYPGTYNTPLALTNASKQLQLEHPNAVIVCFLQAKVYGDVWTLQYDVSQINAVRDASGNIIQTGTTVSLFGKTVDYSNMPVYKNGGTSFVLGSHMLPVFVSDITRTATQDLGSQGTH